MSAIQERPNAFPWPPLVSVAAVALAIVLHWLAPLPWLSGPLSELLFAVGWLVVLGSVAMVISALRTLHGAGTTPSPVRGASHLVTTGPFSFTRNPIYLGAVTTMLGLGLITGIVWFLLLAPISGFIVQKIAVEREERHLEIRFGKKWRDYAKKVRRWI